MAERKAVRKVVAERKAVRKEKQRRVLFHDVGVTRPGTGEVGAGVCCMTTWGKGVADKKLD